MASLFNPFRNNTCHVYHRLGILFGLGSGAITACFPTLT